MMKKKIVNKESTSGQVLVRSLQPDIKLWKNSAPKYDIEFGKDPVLVDKRIADYLLSKNLVVEG